MTALDFPSSPSNGDIYDDFQYSSAKTAWLRIKQPLPPEKFSVGINPPDFPENGEFWLDSSDGISYVYYEDVDSAQWVQFGVGREGPMGPQGPTGATGPTHFTLAAERASSSVVAGNRYSFGDGQNGVVPMFYGGELTGLAVFLGASASGTLTVEIVKNDVLQGAGYRVSVAAGLVAKTTFSTPLEIVALDTVGVEIVTAPGTLDFTSAQLVGTWDL